MVVEPEPISTHTLRKEGDERLSTASRKEIKFQPTPSARRVTAIIASV